MQYSEFNKAYSSVSSTNDNSTDVNTNKFFKQKLPEFMLYQENRSHSRLQGNRSKKMPSGDENRTTATKGILVGAGGVLEDCEVDPVTELFFSNENMRRIQHMIRREIAIRTKNQYKLEVDQDESDLLIAMRAVFFDMYGSRFLPFRINHQVKELNRKVINYIAPDILSNVKEQYAYIKEINSPLQVQNRSTNMSSKGRKSLPSITTIWTR